MEMRENKIPKFQFINAISFVFFMGNIEGRAETENCAQLEPTSPLIQQIIEKAHSTPKSQIIQFNTPDSKESIFVSSRLLSSPITYYLNDTNGIITKIVTQSQKRDNHGHCYYAIYTKITPPPVENAVGIYVTVTPLK